VSYDTLKPKEFLAPSWHQVQDLLFRVIPYVVFFQEEEKKAVEQLAQRVEEESGSFDGWERCTILNPSFFKGEQTLPQVGLLQRQRPQFFTDVDRWKSFRDCLRNHHPFVNVPYGNKRASDSDCGLTKTIQNAGSTRGFEVWTTIAKRNFFDFENHRRRSEDLAITVLSKGDCWAQLVQESKRYVKIICILNEGRAKSLRSWVSSLKQLLLDDCGFGFVWGHAMQVESNVNYPNNSKIDRRFEHWKTVKIETDDGPIVYPLNRLTRLWLKMGFCLAPSPETDESPALALYSDSFFQELLELKPDIWKQFEDFNSSL
jgi:hypothetical protein